LAAAFDGQTEPGGDNVMTEAVKRMVAPETPAADVLLDRARSLIPVLRERTRIGEQLGNLPPETIQDIKDAGLFRILQPKRWGGFEMSPKAFYGVQIALAEGDMSAGWVYGVMGVHNWQIALFDDNAASDVWGRDQNALIASSYMPKGKVTAVEGGFRLSGHWQFSSGSKHADWFFLGGILPERGSEKPGLGTFLIPKADVSVIDNWNVTALQATGSHDVVVKDVFVPAYRTHTFLEGFRCVSPGNTINTSPLYRIPFGQLFTRCVSTASIGALQAMLDQTLAYGSGRVGAWGGKTAEDPGSQYVCAEVAMHVGQMKAVLDAAYDHLELCARESITPNILDRLRYRYQSAEASGRCAELGRRLFKVAGAPALHADKPFSKILANILAGGQHNGNSFETWGRAYGAALLGAENNEVFL
jgi:3-hydroxy-9,10-secoandrosta-1,3,5(10)-triene-9,17-dione monooxygenase